MFIAAKPAKRGRPAKPKAHSAVDFINSLKHTGDFYGKDFALRPWQDEIVRRVFDAKTGKPKYREVFLALPRKQGKTELSGAITNQQIFGTGRPAQRIFSASGDRNQASLIYSAASSMIRQSQALSEVALCYDGYKRIQFRPLDSTYQALSSEHAQQYGLRPSMLMLDELWVLPNRDLFKSLTSAMGATVDPFTIMITTAGWDRTSLCWEQWDYAIKVRDGVIKDPGFLPIIYAADPSDDWTSEETWKKAMPALGDFCQIDFIRRECKKAQQIPAYENTFKQLYLNMWTEQAERWLSLDAWNSCGAEFPTSEQYGQPCYAGYDHGVTGDMACLALVWPTATGIRTWVHGWVPRNGSWQKELRNKDNYPEWERLGYLTFTEGSSIDDNCIENDIVRYSEKCPIMSLFADRAYATALLNRLYNGHRINVKGIPQGPVTMNEACVLLEEMVLDRTIEHGNNEILNWNVANASVVRGPTGLMHLNKSSSTERIDGLAALLNALTAYVADPEHRGPCVYETRGILTL